MQRAARRLAESDDSLAAIAAEVGYDSEFAFSRAFKRHMGEAPGGFRRRSRVEGTFAPPIVCLAALPSNIRGVHETSRSRGREPHLHGVRQRLLPAPQHGPEPGASVGRPLRHARAVALHGS